MKKIITLLALALPSVTFAQTTAINNADDLTGRLLSIGNTALYLLTALAVIFIVWNIVMGLIKSGSDEEATKKARWNVVWGVVGLAIIVSIWGLVNILTNTFRTTPTNQPLPNLGNNTDNGGVPANQYPHIR